MPARARRSRASRPNGEPSLIGSPRASHDSTPVEVADAAQELAREARLADAGLPGHEHGARDRLVDALLERADERRELALASDERRRLAEQRARLGFALAQAADEEAAVVAADVEAHVEQARGGVVEEDGALAVRGLVAERLAPRARALARMAAARSMTSPTQLRPVTVASPVASATCAPMRCERRESAQRAA